MTGKQQHQTPQLLPRDQQKFGLDGLMTSCFNARRQCGKRSCFLIQRNTVNRHVLLSQEMRPWSPNSLGQKKVNSQVYRLVVSGDIGDIGVIECKVVLACCRCNFNHKFLSIGGWKRVTCNVVRSSLRTAGS